MERNEEVGREHSYRVGFHLARIKPSSKDAVLRLSHLCQAHNLVRSLVLQGGRHFTDVTLASEDEVEHQ